MFVPGKPLGFSLMLVDKAGAYLSEAPFVKSFIGLALGLFNKTNCRVKLLFKMGFFTQRGKFSKFHYFKLGNCDIDFYNFRHRKVRNFEISN